MTTVVSVLWNHDNRPDTIIIFNKDRKLLKQYDCWKFGNRKKIIDVVNIEKMVKNLVNNLSEVVILNYKKYVDYFGEVNSKVYDYPGDLGSSVHDHLKFIYKYNDEMIGLWQNIRAEAAEVYSKMEKRGLMLEHKKFFPHYDMNVYSGRSKCSGFNVQSDMNSNIKHIHSVNRIFLHFDWIAADPRIAGIMSNDKILLNTYEKSDPYTYIEEALDNDIDREKCKKEFMRAMYALWSDHEILSIFPKFANWVKEQSKLLNERKYTKSILGRKFFSDGDVKGNRRAFNSIMQGSIAHAMQCVITRVDKEFGDIILTETHDSLTVCVPEPLVLSMIDDISKIMLYPFNGILDYNPLMPLKVSIGKRWGNYKYLKTVRHI